MQEKVAQGETVQVYRLIMAMALPGLVGLTLVQRWRGRVAPGAVAERLGFGPAPGPGATLWLHGASNGELISAHWLLERVIAARPGIQVLVTVNTGTARAMVAGWEMAGVVAALAPVDAAGAAARLLRRWRPAALLVIENELWPGRLADCARLGVPVALIGARMSKRTAAGWARFAPGLMRRMLAGLSMVSAQDEGSARRLVALGLDASRLGPVVMLKSHGMAGAVPGPAALPRDRVLLAASTHPGDEALALAAFQAARGQFDLLILAPRHPRRGGGVAALIAASGLDFTRRSDGAMPGLGPGGAPVFLADTLGEMALWYGMAGATLIGGSFAALGGHTPYEPAAAGSAILHGPDMANFAAPARALAAADAALRVEAGQLAGVLAGLDADRQHALAQAARRVLAPQGDAEALLAAVLRLLRAPQGPLPEFPAVSGGLLPPAV